MERTLPIWILVLLSLGVMLLTELSTPIVRPLESSLPVDKATNIPPQVAEKKVVSVLSPGFAA